MQDGWAIAWSVIGGIGAVVLYIVHILVACRAITRPHRAPASRIAWVAVIMFVPIVGVLAYLFLGETSVGPERVRALNEAAERILRPDDAANPPGQLPPAAQSAFELGHSINGFRAVSGNSVELTANSDAAIDALVADIDAARETVHLSFYIWLDDNNGGRVADAVSAAAQRGVMCRIMVDALGSRLFVRSPRWAQMREAGAHLAVALNDIPRLGRIAIGRVDLRNHRKIVVIDDEIAYCGSQNCADPAFRIKPKFAPWVDVFFRCRGPIVAQQQWLFFTVWDAQTKEAIPADRVRAKAAAAVHGGVTGAMFGTGPTGRAGAMSDMFVAAIALARHELTITTPYFVPDEPMLAALCAAPRRGVQTTIVLPARNDSWLVAESARSTYERMLDAGIVLYEYPLGLLHSKTLTVDGTYALVGSANMDRRSLELNYENNLLVFDPGVYAQVRTRQQEYLDDSELVDADVVRRWSFGKRLVQNAVGMLAPLL